jgi:hypothetical protein
MFGWKACIDTFLPVRGVVFFSHAASREMAATAPKAIVPIRIARLLSMMVRLGSGIS